MKRILYLIVFTAFVSITNAQTYSDGCMNMTFRATRAWNQEYEDPFANDESNWQWYFLDVANQDGAGWQGGQCLAQGGFYQIGWWNHTDYTVHTFSYGASGANATNVPQYFNLRGRYEGDDCGGSCDHNTSCFFDDDDYIFDDLVSSNIDYRFAAPNTANSFQRFTSWHGSADYGGEFTVNWTSPRPIVTASATEVCQGTTTAVTLNFTGAVFGGTYEVYDGGSLVHSSTAASWVVNVSSTKTFQVYTRNNGVNSNCYATITITAINCDFNCRTRGWTGPQTITCPNQANIATTAVSFDGLGFPSNTYIADVDVEIEWSDYDSDEVNFWFYSQNGGTESTSLVDGAEVGASNLSYRNGIHATNMNTIFDEDASFPGNPFTPTDNQRVNPPVFDASPNSGNVEFDKWEVLDQNANTDWYIRAGASQNCSDNLIVHSYAVTICGCKPPVTNSANVTDGTNSSNGSITICADQGGTISLSVTGSTNSFNNNGYGDELKWYESSCGGTFLGSGNPLTIPAPTSTGTHQYYAMFWVDNEKCRAANYCDRVDVIVDAVTVAGNVQTTVGANLFETICFGVSTPSQLTINGNTGTVVNWEMSTDAATWNIVQTGGNTYTPSSFLGANTYYIRANVKNNVCSIKPTPNFILQIQAPPVSGNIIPATLLNVCNGDLWTLNLVSQQGNIQWKESSAVGGPFSNVASNGNSDSYFENGVNNTSSPTSKFYRVEMSNTPCPVVNTNVVEVKIFPTPIGGTTHSDQVLCYDATPLDVTLTGHSGGSVKEWEVDDDFAFGSPTTVANTTTTLTGAEIRTAMGSPLNQSLYVRAIVDNVGCPETESSNVDLEINNPQDIDFADNTGSCTITSNTWVHIFDATSKKIIASIDANGQNLGNVTATVYYHGGSSFTIPATGTCAMQQAVMNRSFVITSANTFVNPVGVRLYFTNAELADLIDNSLSTQSTGGALTWPTHDPNGCQDDDDVLSINDVFVTQISGSGASENGVFDAGLGTFKLHSPTNSSVGNANYGANYVEFSVTGFSEFWLHGSEHGVPLPVELLDFNVQVVENKTISLKWTTSTEINNSGFEIERSTDGIHFIKIAWVEGNGNSNAIIEYSFIDKEVTKGTYYYRLKQIDFDDEFEYSETKSASILSREGNVVSFFIPNPSNSNAVLEFNLNQDSEVTIEIYNNIGKLVDFKTKLLSSGSDRVLINTNKYSSGIYIAKISINDEKFTRKLIVNK